ncbi:receptor kinase-like protein Xa21 [Nymphaea colorata]|nr:receptor kinase-like protein Xa21 [Nymphaea colorata]
MQQNNFDNSNLIGSGSFGSVYKGILSDGTTIAVKVLNLLFEGALNSFSIECEVVSKVGHQNLLRIISSCTNEEFKALVLQYMPRGSLENCLYASAESLNLLQRLDIMIDVACAIEYLHHDFFEPILHCDLKPSNVLLGGDMIAYVADFGIAKILVRSKSSTLTETLGTTGYIAPGTLLSPLMEHQRFLLDNLSHDQLPCNLEMKSSTSVKTVPLMCSTVKTTDFVILLSNARGIDWSEFGLSGKVSTKADVYSYGVLLLETFTRRKPTDAMFAGDFSLIQWVADALPDAVVGVVDGRLLYGYGSSSYNGQQEAIRSNTRIELLVSILQVGLLCSRESPTERTNMREVVADLKKIRANLSVLETSNMARNRSF